MRSPGGSTEGRLTGDGAVGEPDTGVDEPGPWALTTAANTTMASTQATVWSFIAGMIPEARPDPD